MGRLLALVGLCLFSTSAFADIHQDLLTNLEKRIVKVKGNGSLIQSYPKHKQSYIYDQALAIIAFSRARDQKNARALMKGLQELQLPDGSLYFSYNMDGTSPYPAEGDRRFAGAIAWVALAATHYQAEFATKEFIAFNLRILSYMSSEIIPYGSLRFSPSDIASTPWKENEVAALEHNLDAFAAFTHFSALNADSSWKKEIQILKKFSLSLWDKDRSHFWSGMNVRTKKINRDEMYLDNQTWSVLALDDETLKKIKSKDALALNCDEFYTEAVGISGFFDSRPTRGLLRHEFVWSEGSLGQIMAMEKAGFRCGQKSNAELTASVLKMKTGDGGIAYATKSSNPDFTTASSVAGTAWMWLALNKVNPFSVTPASQASLQIARTSRRAP